MTLRSMKRRLLALLAADTAGYTLLMELHEEDTHARLSQLRTEIIDPCIRSHRGIVKHIGDGFLAQFASTTDAVDCAMSIQDSLTRAASGSEHAPILLRIGIHLADVIVEPNDIFGDGVNLAARLQASAEPGGIVISSAVAEQLRTRADIQLIDLGVLNLRHMRRPVRAFSVATHATSPLPRLAATLALPQDRPSIAVLPFSLRAAGEDDTWFADGVIEGIIHVLSGIENLFVIGRGTCLAYADGDVDPRAVGRDLGVRYVLTGSVSRSASWLRIQTELIDATTGNIISSKRHDGAVADLFDMQDDIALDVVAAIAPAVRDHELARALRKHPDSMTSYDLVLQALDLMYRLEEELFHRARGLFQQAIAHDPAYAPAYSHSATWHSFRIGQGWSPDIQADAAEAARCALAAIERDRNDAVALAIYGQILSFTRRDYQGARYFLDHALSLGPSCHMAWSLSSTTAGWTGDGARAVEHARRALQLSPFDPFTFFTEHMLSQGYYVSGDYEQAVAWGRRAAMRNEMLTSNLRTLTASLVALGDMQEARETAQRVLAVEPGFRLERFAARSAFRREILEYHIPRLRAAGLPD